MNDSTIQKQSVQESSFFVRNEKWIIPALFVVALTIRLLHLQQIYENDPYFYNPSVDPTVYHNWAKEIAGGDWIGKGMFFNSPLYPYFLGIIYSISGQSIVVAKIVQCLIGSASCMLIYMLAKRLFDIRVAVISGIIACFYSMFIFYEGLLLITNIQTPLSLLLLFLLDKFRDKPNTWKWIFAGLVMGLAVLARPNVLLFVPCALGWIFLQFENEIRKKSMKAMGLFVIGTVVVIAPVTLRNYLVTDQFVLINSQGGVNFFIGNNIEADGYFMVPSVVPRYMGDTPERQREGYKMVAEQVLGKKLVDSENSRFWFDQGLKYIWNMPGQWIKLELKKVLELVNYYEFSNNRNYEFSRRFSWVTLLPLVSFSILMPFALLGIILSVKKWRRLLHVYSFLLTYAASLVIFFNLSRYRVPMVTFLIIFAAYAVVRAFEVTIEENYKQLIKFGAALVVFYLLVNINFVEINMSMPHYNLGNRYYLQGKYDLARAEYLMSIKLDPSYILAYHNLAQSCERKPEHHEEALTAWEIVYKMAEKNCYEKMMQKAKAHILCLRKK